MELIVDGDFPYIRPISAILMPLSYISTISFFNSIVFLAFFFEGVLAVETFFGPMMMLKEDLTYSAVRCSRKELYHTEQTPPSVFVKISRKTSGHADKIRGKPMITMRHAHATSH
ncbi:unnamed protein product [Larinioides sclopetarius]|uniref:Uncharacterized protein n=1 Tax=Larinioides sclopetarius TaxID=280406 RepID=A0AAV1Z1I4_9ARAC